MAGELQVVIVNNDTVRRNMSYYSPATKPDNPGGRNMHFGIREHAMGAVLNGIRLVKLRPCGAGWPPGRAPPWRVPTCEGRGWCGSATTCGTSR